MKHKITTVAAALIALSLPLSVYAAESTAPMPPMQQKPMDKMACPMMGNMDAMQKDMRGMMNDMNGMMQMMSDPAMKERMQKMHENMAVMMQQMSGMPKMCGKNCPMMEKMGEEKVNEAPAAPAAATPEDHKAHHPQKQ